MTTESYGRTESAPNVAAARPHLFVAMTCTAPGEGASRHLLEGVDDVRLGRSAVRGSRRTAANGRESLSLEIVDGHMSSAHARLSRTSDGWALEDLDSKNGTFVNGRAVRDTKLADGDKIRIGSTLFLFRERLLTPRPSSPDVFAKGQAPAFATLLPTLAREFDALARIAATEIPILLLSETGTGKELVARAIHTLSGRTGAFVPINCGALPQTLAESALFGHKRGAFSGATSDSVGLLRSAEDGTLLLDEIGDFPQMLQPTLLRTLQDGEVMPVGASAPTRLRARFIAATHVDLERRASTGAFREDLFARLAGYVFRLPPLRERREDIGLLTCTLLQKLADRDGRVPILSVEAGERLLEHDWPRNVRELEKALARAAVLAGEGPIEPEHLPAEVQAAAGRSISARERGVDAMPRGRERLVALLTEHRGNLQAVADAMRTSRSQVHRLIRRLDLDVTTYRLPRG